MKQTAYIIAEVGVNHNGSIPMAKQLIEIAADAGVDAVKFQTFKTQNLVTGNAPTADYQKKNTGSQETQYELLQRLELDEVAHTILIEHCNACNIQFLSAPFDIDSVRLLVKNGISQIKIPSGEITNGPLLLEIARTGTPVILSTGMSSLGEIEDALSVLAFGYIASERDKPSNTNFYSAYCSDAGQAVLQEKVVLLHCTSEYPAPFRDVNLRAMDTMRNAFGLPVGLSDHTEGIAIPIAAVARGAVMIEKHFTLDKTLPGPDHKASIEPHELKSMVDAVRKVEQALGIGKKIPAKSELNTKQIARKSLVAAQFIAEGDKFNAENLISKRPGDGISPMRYWEWLGRSARKKYIKDEKIQYE